MLLGHITTHCEAALSNRQTKQLVVAGRTSQVEWTRDDTTKAFGQGWGLFTEYGNKVMRVLCILSKPITGIVTPANN
jgi:malonyl CoA-acyl carrier protein transacylase